MRLSLALVALLLLVAAKPAKPPKAPPVPPGSLGGSVKVNNAPVPDATVHVWHGKKEVATVKVDAKGEFRLPLAAETYEVQASAPSFHPAVPIHITVVVNAQRETWVNLDMLPGA
jgi:hypothetical protein